MHRHDGFRPRRHGASDLIGIGVERDRIDVDQNRPRAETNDGAGGREKRVGRRDDFVVGANPERHQGQQHGIGAGRHGDRVPDPEHPRQLLLERVDFGPHDEPLAVGDARHGSEDLVAQRPVLRLEIEQWDR